MQDSFSELSRQDLVVGTGKRTRVLPAFGPALYHVVLRAFPPLQILPKDQFRFQKQADKVLPRQNSFDVVSSGIRPAKIASSRPGHVRNDVTGQFPIVSSQRERLDRKSVV